MTNNESPRISHQTHKVRTLLLQHKSFNPQMDMDASFSILQLIVAPLIIPLLPPAAVHFLTENERPSLDQNIEELSLQPNEPNETSES